KLLTRLLKTLRQPTTGCTLPLRVHQLLNDHRSSFKRQRIFNPMISRNLVLRRRFRKTIGPRQFTRFAGRSPIAVSPVTGRPLVSAR
ncbi:hypothetical protein T265_14243, partial [Opisthorchis viverrini]